MKNAIVRSILNYYVALKLSAGAIADIDWPVLEDGPAPIVRRYVQYQDAPWDPREILTLNGKTAIVTVPARRDSASEYATIRLN